MIKRLARRDDCGECGRPFKDFEVVHYLGIDNNTFCAECREKLAPGKKDDLHDLGGWVRCLYVGLGDKGRENIQQIVTLWNESLSKYDYHLRIEL